MLAEYIKSDLIFLDLEATDRSDLFSQLAKKYTEKGYVNDGFLDFLNTREDNYPTGLDLGAHQVAIPHGDPKYIKHPFISVVRLVNSVGMKKMEDPDADISVKLFFVLGLTDGGSHINVLREVIKHLQDDVFVTQILKAKTSGDVLATF